MSVLLVGVIGHVDHGKTALVRALTGIETDRLKEERERGISIVLGFAHLRLDGGEIDLIDMPGHERFVGAMVGGATGIDAVLLVVAANEGVRSQTVEHLEIATLLGIRRGVIAVSKCDLVTPEEARRQGVAAQDLVREANGGAWPIVFTSAVDESGLPELRRILGRLARNDARKGDCGFPFLPVDRVFSVAGFGTVVTGTLRRGALAVGDTVEILPSGRRTRVRSLQSHGRSVERLEPGRRAAVNLRGIERAELHRGDALAAPGIVPCSRWLDVELNLLASAPAPLRGGDELRLLIGCMEAAARLRLLDKEVLHPGECAPAQLRCDPEIATPAREPFILRISSPPRTIGGGTVLRVASRRRRRHDAALIGALRELRARSPRDILASELRRAGTAGLRLNDAATLLGVAPPLARLWAKEMEAEVFGDGTAIGRHAYAELQEATLRELAAFHAAHPRAPGVSRERLRAALPEGAPASVVNEMLGRLVAARRLAQSEGMLRRPEFVPPRRDMAGEEAAGAVAEIFRAAALSPPDLAAVIGGDRRRLALLRSLVRAGLLIRAPDRVQGREILFHREAVALARRRLHDAFGDGRRFLAGDAGRALGISRKFGIPLLELFDRLAVTRREGDARTIVRRAAPDTPPRDEAGDQVVRGGASSYR